MSELVEHEMEGAVWAVHARGTLAYSFVTVQRPSRSTEGWVVRKEKGEVAWFPEREQAKEHAREVARIEDAIARLSGKRDF